MFALSNLCTPSKMWLGIFDFCLVFFGGKERYKWYRGRNVTTGICGEYGIKGGLTTHAAQGIGFAGPRIQATAITGSGTVNRPQRKAA